MGKIANGDYQLCVSKLLQTESRNDMFDFVVMGKSAGYLLAYIPQISKIDLSFFHSKFQSEISP